MSLVARPTPWRAGSSIRKMNRAAPQGSSSPPRSRSVLLRCYPLLSVQAGTVCFHLFPSVSVPPRGATNAVACQQFTENTASRSSAPVAPYPLLSSEPGLRRPREVRMTGGAWRPPPPTAHPVGTPNPAKPQPRRKQSISLCLPSVRNHLAVPPWRTRSPWRILCIRRSKFVRRAGGFLRPGTDLQRGDAPCLCTRMSVRPTTTTKW